MNECMEDKSNYSNYRPICLKNMQNPINIWQKTHTLIYMLDKQRNIYIYIYRQQDVCRAIYERNTNIIYVYHEQNLTENQMVDWWMMYI